MKTILYWTSIITLVCCTIACDKTTETTDLQTFVVSSGTSFGECWGYCLSEMNITNAEVDYHRVGWGGDNDPNFPRVNCQMTISEAQQNDLKNSFDATAFQALDMVLGCPDCADGGAEWIEVRTEDFTKKVTFDYSVVVEEMADFQTEVRAIRALFEDCQ